MFAHIAEAPAAVGESVPRGDEELKNLLGQDQEEYGAIAHRADITGDQKVTRVIKITTPVCAGVATQPISFADIVVLALIQI